MTSQYMFQRFAEGRRPWINLDKTKRKCCVCGKVHPLTVEYFKTRQNYGKPKYRNYCTRCEYEYNKGIRLRRKKRRETSLRELTELNRRKKRIEVIRKEYRIVGHMKRVATGIESGVVIPCGKTIHKLFRKFVD
jgi:hypothetical protein